MHWEFDTCGENLVTFEGNLLVLETQKRFCSKKCHRFSTQVLLILSVYHCADHKCYHSFHYGAAYLILQHGFDWYSVFCWRCFYSISLLSYNASLGRWNFDSLPVRVDVTGRCMDLTSSLNIWNVLQYLIDELPKNWSTT